MVWLLAQDNIKGYILPDADSCFFIVEFAILVIVFNHFTKTEIVALLERSVSVLVK